MNLIIMCFCSLFINISCLGSENSQMNRVRPSLVSCDDVITEGCVLQTESKKSELRSSLVDILLEENEDEESKSNLDLDRIQIVVPTFHSRPNKFPKRLKKYSVREKRKRRKWLKNRKNHKKHNIRHSRKKLITNMKQLATKQRFNITFETQPENIIRGKIPTLNMPIKKIRENVEIDVTKNGGKTSTKTRRRKTKTSQFRNRRIPKGRLKGKRGRRRQFNPNRGAKKVIVRTHNILRGRVWPPAQNMLAMSWHSGAAEEAKLWADECRLDSKRDHPSVRWTPMHGTCGQNVQLSFKKMRWGRVVRQWWNERRYFRFGRPGNNETRVGRYTQMAWYNSHKVGCGYSECKTPLGKPFFRYVCNYCPVGNDPRRFSRPYDEGRQCGSCPSSCKSVCNRGGCKLCTNSCPFADLWSNCESLALVWKQWLCNTKTRDGVARFKNCRATCQCSDKIT